MLLFETLLPVRFYLPPDDVVVDLQPSETVTYCAYKGRASYFSVPDGPADVAWTYHQPLHDAEPVRDRIAFSTSAWTWWSTASAGNARPPSGRADGEAVARIRQADRHVLDSYAVRM